MTRVYVSGPMTGLPDCNYPAFNEVSALLRRLGFEVENPAENERPACGSWLGYMRLSLIQIARSDRIFMLRGWEDSKGARLERDIAIGLGLPVDYQHRRGEHIEPGKESA